MTTNKLKVSAALQKRMDAVPLGWIPPNLTAQKEMFRKCVVLDVHGPFLGWDRAVVSVAKELYGVDIDLTQVRHYMLGYDVNFPLNPTQFGSVFGIVARMKGKDGYGGLTLEPGSQDTIKAFADHGIRWEFWTWVPGATEHDPETLKAWGTGIAQSATYEILAKNGLVTNPQRQIRFIKPGDKPGAMAADHLPLIVEDNPITAVAAGYAYGNACILTPAPYNEHLVSPGVLRLNDLSELGPAVIDFFEKLEKAGAILAGV